MKMTIKSAVIAGVGILAMTTMLARGRGGGSGQPVHTVRFSSRFVFTSGSGTNGSGTNTPAGPSATGSFSSTINRNTDRETIAIRARSLTPSNPYSIFATEFGTNAGDIADFTSDKNGNARVTASTVGTKKHPATLPFGLELFNVTELDIVDDSNTNATEIILTADTTSPTSFSFSSRQTQTGTNGETGTLTISGTNRRAPRLSLTAAGLNTNTDFILSLVGGTGTNSVGTNNSTFTSDPNGNLRINNATISANVLDITEVDLLDTSEGNAAVLIFPLP